MAKKCQKQSYNSYLRVTFISKQSLQMCKLDKIMYLNNLVKLSSLGYIYIDHRPTHIRLLNCTGNRQNTQMLQKLLLD